MEAMFLSSNTNIGGSIAGMPATFIFDAKHGTAIGRFTIRNPGLLGNLSGGSFPIA